MKIMLLGLLLMLLDFSGKCQTGSSGVNSPDSASVSLQLTQGQLSQIDSINQVYFAGVAGLSSSLTAQGRKVVLDSLVGIKEQQLQSVMTVSQYALYLSQRAAVNSKVQQRLAAKAASSSH